MTIPDNILEAINDMIAEHQSSATDGLNHVNYYVDLNEIIAAKDASKSVEMHNAKAAVLQELIGRLEKA